IHRRKRKLVARIGIQARAAVGGDARPVRSEELRLVARKSRTVLLKRGGDRVEVAIGLERRGSLERVEPLGELVWRDLSPLLWDAEAFERDDRSDALRSRSGIEHHDVAAQAVADKPRRFLRREVVEQRVEIGK